jgi:hypothetical protein
MDPLSIAANVLAVAGAVRLAGKGVSKLRILFDAPGQVDALTNELSNLQRILRELHLELLQDELSSSTIPQNLPSIVERARAKAQEIEEFIDHQIKKPSSSDVRSTAWARKKNRVIGLRKDLRSIREDLILACDVFLMCVKFVFAAALCRTESWLMMA